jgi:uncharacterized membrane protein
MMNARKAVDVAAEAVSLLLLAGIAVYLAIRWDSIPDIIPCHFNAMGVADGWGAKKRLLILPILAGLLYFLLTGVSAMTSMMARMKAGNMPEALPPYLKSMLKVQKIEVMLLFFYLTYCMAENRNLSGAFLPVIIAVIVGTIFVFLISMLIKSKGR